MPGMRPPILAALDLGTNNCRLLVARPARDGFDILESFSRIVRLGEGVAACGILSEAAMERTVAALKVCARIMSRRGVGKARCVATEACRRARNGPIFLERVRKATGIDLEVLPHWEESRLALLGCLSLVDPRARHVLMVDIGGGSSEVLWLDRDAAGRPELRAAISIPCGVVTLSETHGAAQSADDFEAMVADVEGQLRPHESKHVINARIAGQTVQMIGTSGTVTTLAALHLDLPRYDRARVDGLHIDFAAINDVSLRLRGLDDAQRSVHPCIGPGRADLVVAGCAILEAIHRVWPTEGLRVADRGVREGILHVLNGRTLESALATIG